MDPGVPELAKLQAPFLVELVLEVGVEQADRADVAAGVEDDGVRQVLREDVAVDTRTETTELKAVLDVVAAGVPVGDVAELGDQARLQHEVAVAGLDLKPVIPAGREGLGLEELALTGGIGGNGGGGGVTLGLGGLGGFDPADLLLQGFDLALRAAVSAGPVVVASAAMTNVGSAATAAARMQAVVRIRFLPKIQAATIATSFAALARAT
ncbi:MAG: hypothetical protein QM754_02040 [Tepidisphaeraceae bacterium]